VVVGELTVGAGTGMVDEERRSLRPGQCLLLAGFELPYGKTGDTTISPAFVSVPDFSLSIFSLNVLPIVVKSSGYEIIFRTVIRVAF
jgi:hypothetical protein